MMKRWMYTKLLTLLVVTASCLLLFSATALAQADPAASDTAEPGVLIVEVDPPSPAAMAGVTRGDIILQVNNAAVNDAAAMRKAIRTVAPNETVTLTILHGDDERQIEVALGERNGQSFLGIVPYTRPVTVSAPAPPAAARPFERAPLSPTPPGADMTETVDMTVTLAVVDVVAESSAATAGLQRDDVITAVNGEALTAPDALANVVQTLAPGDSITLTVQPADGDGVTEEFVVTLGEHPDDANRAFLGIQFAPMIRVERGVRSFVPGEPPMGRFQFRGPRFLPPMDPEQEECQCQPRSRRGWFFRGGGEPNDAPGRQNNAIPTPNHFFWFEEMPSDSNVIIFRRSNHQDEPSPFNSQESDQDEPMWLENRGYFARPKFVQPAVPAQPVQFEIEIADDLI